MLEAEIQICYVKWDGILLMGDFNVEIFETDFASFWELYDTVAQLLQLC